MTEQREHLEEIQDTLEWFYDKYCSGDCYHDTANEQKLKANILAAQNYIDSALDLTEKEWEAHVTFTVHSKVSAVDEETACEKARQLFEKHIQGSTTFDIEYEDSHADPVE